MSAGDEKQNGWMWKEGRGKGQRAAQMMGWDGVFSYPWLIDGEGGFMKGGFMERGGGEGWHSAGGVGVGVLAPLSSLYWGESMGGVGRGKGRERGRSCGWGGREEGGRREAVAIASLSRRVIDGCRRVAVTISWALAGVQGWSDGMGGVWGRKGREGERGVARVVWRAQGGEWRKMKGWSKKAAAMNEEWRRDYARARNETMREREEFMRENNGTDPWLQAKESFDFELWQLLRTLSGYR